MTQIKGPLAIGYGSLLWCNIGISVNIYIIMMIIKKSVNKIHIDYNGNYYHPIYNSFA